MFLYMKVKCFSNAASMCTVFLYCRETNLCEERLVFKSDSYRFHFKAALHNSLV